MGNSPPGSGVGAQSDGNPSAPAAASPSGQLMDSSTAPASAKNRSPSTGTGVATESDIFHSANCMMELQYLLNCIDVWVPEGVQKSDCAEEKMKLVECRKSSRAAAAASGPVAPRVKTGGST